MDLLDTFNIVVKLTENFLQTFEKKVAAQHMRFYQNEVKKSGSYFELQLFFQMFVENFL